VKHCATKKEADKIRSQKNPRMTDDQMKALELFVAASKDATEFGRNAVIYALRQTDNLTQPVYLSLPTSPSIFADKRAEEMYSSVCRMLSIDGTTRISLFFKGMGTEFGLSCLRGGFYPDGRFGEWASERTIWISPIVYDRGAKRIKPDTQEIEAVKLPA